jgi:hypothetical protein
MKSTIFKVNLGSVGAGTKPIKIKIFKKHILVIT